jgi:hypothetical protein
VDGKIVDEDTKPSLEKIYPISDGFMVQSITGVRTRIVSRLDGKGYDVAKCQFTDSLCLLDTLISSRSGPSYSAHRSNSLHK